MSGCFWSLIYCLDFWREENESPENENENHGMFCQLPMWISNCTKGLLPFPFLGLGQLARPSPKNDDDSNISVWVMTFWNHWVVILPLQSFHGRPLHQPYFIQPLGSGVPVACAVAHGSRAPTGPRHGDDPAIAGLWGYLWIFGISLVQPALPFDC